MRKGVLFAVLIMLVLLPAVSAFSLNSWFKDIFHKVFFSPEELSLEGETGEGGESSGFGNMCPSINCRIIPEGCTASPSKPDENGCPQCPIFECPADSGDDSGGDGGDSCPTLTCPEVPPSCSALHRSLDENGCPQCPIIECFIEGDGGDSGGDDGSGGGGELGGGDTGEEGGDGSGESNVFIKTALPKCVAYAYGWSPGVCTPVSVQTRIITYRQPEECEIIPPISMSRFCPEQPRCAGFTYSSWGGCQEGVQERTAVGSPSGCVGGEPILSESCIYNILEARISSCGTINTPGNYEILNNLNSRGNCIIIVADNVILGGNGFTITGTGEKAQVGILVKNADNVRIKKLKVSGFDKGISLLNSNDATIEQGWMQANNYGLHVQDGLRAHVKETLFGKDLSITNGEGFGRPFVNPGEANKIAPMSFSGIESYLTAQLEDNTINY